MLLSKYKKVHHNIWKLLLMKLKYYKLLLNKAETKNGLKTYNKYTKTKGAFLALMTVMLFNY